MYTQNFSSTPIIVAKQNTANGWEGSWARNAGTHTAEHHDFYAEEDYYDSELYHPHESFGYWAFEGAFSYSQDVLVSYPKIDWDASLETPKSSYKTYTTNVSNPIHANSTTIPVAFVQDDSHAFSLETLDISSENGTTTITSEGELISQFGDNILHYEQNQIHFPENMHFSDLYDPRTFVYEWAAFNQSLSTYNLSQLMSSHDINVSEVTAIKDIYYANDPTEQPALYASQLSRANYSIEGTFGTDNLNITFHSPLPAPYFAVQLTTDPYPENISLELTCQAIDHELAVTFGKILNNTYKRVYLDVANSSFAFQDDMALGSTILNNYSNCVDADLIYDYQDQLHIIYSEEINNSYSHLHFQHTIYNSTNDKIAYTTNFSQQHVNLQEYEYYKLMKNIEDLSMYDLDAALRKFFGKRKADENLEKEGIGLKALSRGEFDCNTLQELKRNLKKKAWDYWVNDISNFGGRDAFAVSFNPIDGTYSVKEGAKARARLSYQIWKMLTTHFGEDISNIEQIPRELQAFLWGDDIFEISSALLVSSTGSVKMNQEHLEAVERAIRNMEKTFYSNLEFTPHFTEFDKFYAFDRDYELLQEDFRSYEEEAFKTPFGGRVGGQIGGFYKPKITDANSYMAMMYEQFTLEQRREKAQSIRQLTKLLDHNKLHQGAFEEREKSFYEAHKDDSDRYSRNSQYYYNVRQRLGHASREKIWTLLNEWTSGKPIRGGDILAPAKAGKISYVDNEIKPFDPSQFSGMLPKVLKRVMFLAKDDVSHETLQDRILKDPWLKSFFLGKEISVWTWSKDQEALLAGHLDMIFLIDGALFYFEYKPGDAHEPDSAKLSEHLFQAIPQASVGALSLMSIMAGRRGLNEDLSIDIPVYCIPFNHEGAYIHEPSFLRTFSMAFAKFELLPVESDWDTYFSGIYFDNPPDYFSEIYDYYYF